MKLKNRAARGALPTQKGADRTAGARQVCDACGRYHWGWDHELLVLYGATLPGLLVLVLVISVLV